MTRTDKQYVVDPDLRWIYPQQEAPLKGVKLSLLTRGGVQVVGFWQDGGDYLAWQRLFKRDHTLERSAE